MKYQPKVIGFVDIPLNLKDYGNSGFTRRIVRALLPGKALQIDLQSEESARHYQHIVLNAGIHEFGAGHVQTAIDGQMIYVWLRASEPDPLADLPDMIVDEGIQHGFGEGGLRMDPIDQAQMFLSETAGSERL